MIKTIKLFLFIAMMGSFSCLYGQVQPQNSLYLLDLYQLNPAYGGLERSLSINFNYRDQWTGFDQHPKQLYINANMPLYLINGGVGMTVASDRIGALNMNSFQISYNNIRKTHFGIISGGLSLGYSQTRLNNDILITPDGIYQDGIINHNDLIINGPGDSGGQMNYELGLFVGHPSFDFGLSVKNLFFKDSKVGEISINNPNLIKLYGRMPLYINDILLYPTFLLKTDFYSYQTDISILAKSGSVFGGLTLRGYNSQSLDSVVILGGVKINDNYTISYGYDLGISGIKRISQGAHEVIINYNLNKLIGLGLPPEIIYNPRNL